MPEHQHKQFATQMKILSQAAASPDLLSIALPYIPPFGCDTVLTFYRCHQIPFIDSVDEGGYERIARTNNGLGWFRLKHPTRHHSIHLTLLNGSETDLALKQELKRHPEIQVERLRPWRAYAGAALWKSFGEEKRERYEPLV